MPETFIQYSLSQPFGELCFDELSEGISFVGDTPWWQQLDNDVSGAFQSFEDFCDHIISAIGFTFLGIEDFIRFLGENGLDPIEVIPMLANHASSRGGNPTAVLEEVASGVIQEGPAGYTSRLIRQHFLTPLEIALRHHAQTATTIGSIHQTTLNSIHTKLTTLRQGGGNTDIALSGSLADAVDAQFAEISTAMNKLMASGSDPGSQYWDHQNQIDQQTLAAYQFIDQNLHTILLIDLLIVVVEVVMVVLAGAATVYVAGLGAVPLAGVFVGLDAIIFGGEFLGPFLSWIILSLFNILLLGVTELGQLIHTITTSSVASQTTTHQMSSITLVGGGAANGGQTVVVKGDGTGSDVGGLTVDVQQDLAWDAAKDCEAARQTYNRTHPQYKGKINFAVGLLSLNGQLPPEPYGPILGYGSQDTHSEQVIVDYWSGTRLPLLKAPPGSQFVLLIFTRVQMCAACRAMVPTWIQQLAAAAGPGVTIHFYLWQSIDPTKSVGSGNLQPVP
jgi:hypothetical protein